MSTNTIEIRTIGSQVLPAVNCHEGRAHCVLAAINMLCILLMKGWGSVRPGLVHYLFVGCLFSHGEEIIWRNNFITMNMSTDNLLSLVCL